jgi:hypothetical protein
MFMKHSLAIEVNDEIEPFKGYRRRLADDINVYEIADLIDVNNLQTARLTSTSTRPIEALVDLTGDVELSSFHNKMPLFNKSNGSEDSDERALLSFSQEIEEEIEKNLITINIKIKNKIRKYKHPEDQRFYELIKRIAKEENVSVNSVYFYNKKDRISPESTLKSINHRISTIYSKIHNSV